MAKDPKLPRGISMQAGKYRVRMFHEGVQHSLGVFDTLGDAKAALAIARGEKARGLFVPPAQRRREREAQAAIEATEAVTFAEWSEQWLDGLRRKDAAESSIVTHRSVLRTHLLPTLGDRRLAEITPDDVDRLIAQLQALPSQRNPGAKSNGIAANAARTLRACLNAAVKARRSTGLEVSPFQATVPSPKRVRRTDPGGDVATPAEVRAIAAAMPARLRISVPLAAWCALRLGEVLGLERGDLEHLDDPERAVLHVRRQMNSKTSPPSLTAPKADSTRSVAIPAFMLDDLRQHLELYAAPGTHGPLLTDLDRSGARVSQTAFDNAWRTAREAGGRPRLRYHDLRHAGLTAYAQQGATLAELLHRGGHSDVSVALRYQHASAERDRALTAKLSGVVG